MTNEVVTYWIGQCGIQMGNASWELICLEHNIKPDGQLKDGYYPEDNKFKHLFNESPNDQFIPHAISVDLEPTVLDEIRTGIYRRLFHPDYLINTFEDASSNFARGFYKQGKYVINEVVNSSRKIGEMCEMIQGFVVNHSCGGGTGSGFSSMLMEFLEIEYPKVAKLQLAIFPSPTLSTSVTEPYNASFSIHSTMELCDLAIVMDNDALFSICENKLCFKSALYTTLNRLQAQVFSGLTASFRFEGQTTSKFTDLQTNLVPFPRIHFLLSTFSPIRSPQKTFHDVLSLKEITVTAFSEANQFVVIDLSEGLYMACVTLYRGDISSSEITSTLHDLKYSNKISFTDWSPTGFKTSINYQPMTLIPQSGMGYSDKSVTLIINNTAIKTVISNLNKKFLMLFNKRAFVHWYIGEGMEESEFNESFTDVLALEEDFTIIENKDRESKQFLRENSEVIKKNNKHDDQNIMHSSNHTTITTVTATSKAETSKATNEQDTKLHSEKVTNRLELSSESSF